MFVVWVIVTCSTFTEPVWLVLKVDWPNRIENKKKEPAFRLEQKPSTYG